MIIGVDGGALAAVDPQLGYTGVAKVTQRVLKYISQSEYSNYYRVYTFRERGEGRSDLIDFPRENIRYLPERGYMKIWTPVELVRDPVDVYIGLSQVLPAIPKSVRVEKSVTTGREHHFGRRRKISDIIHDSYVSRKQKLFSRRIQFPICIGLVHDLGFFRYPDMYPGSQSRHIAQTKHLVSRADRIIAVSQSTKKDLIRQFGDGIPPIDVWYEGVDDIFTDTGSVYPHANPYFLHVGAMKIGKNIPTTIRAFAIARKSLGEEVDLILVGNNYWPDPGIPQAIHETGLAGHVITLGTVDDVTLAALYRGARALVSPSLWEGFCLPAAEAMRSGCPVIVSDRGSLPEITGKVGIIHTPLDVEGIAASMVKAVQDPGFRSRHIREGITISRKYTWASFAQGILNSIQAMAVKEV